MPKFDSLDIHGCFPKTVSQLFQDVVTVTLFARSWGSLYVKIYFLQLLCQIMPNAFNEKFKFGYMVIEQ